MINIENKHSYLSIPENDQSLNFDDMVMITTAIGRRRQPSVSERTSSEQVSVGELSLDDMPVAEPVKPTDLRYYAVGETPSPPQVIDIERKDTDVMIVDLVRTLERCLEQIRSGTVSSIHIAATAKDKADTTSASISDLHRRMKVAAIARSLDPLNLGEFDEKKYIYAIESAIHDLQSI